MERTFRSVLLLSIAACLLTGCLSTRYLQQGWSEAERSIFYYTSQGSRLIPRDWFLALERDDSQDRFLADGLERFGYLPGAPVGDRLPIGFVRDGDLNWIGMTCAACHTSDITFGGTTVRVDGAPASADMYAFLAKLDLALRKAAGDAPAFARFAAQVLGANDSAANRAVLREDPEKGIRAFSGKFRQFVTDSTPTAHLQWGPARADAFGMIFNRVTNIDLGKPVNNRPPNAPVSYPFLWGTSWHDFTQWNGAIPNGGTLGEIHRLARNIGQVLGVFGTVELNNSPPYPSSVRRANLMALERGISNLTAPNWPDEFGVPDPARVARGAMLYQSQQCVVCHKLVPKDDQKQFVQVTKVPVGIIGTDDAMTNMVATRLAESGVLQGRRLKPVPFVPSRPVGPNELASDLLSHVVIGAMLHSEDPATIATQGPQYPAELFDATVVNQRNYKARPLNGIWATGPYLHNGSVRTLHELLLPPAQRQPRFHVGSRKFDPVQVGFADEPGVIRFELDTTLPGNRNTGHWFGTGMTNEERKDLVEYLKTL